MGRKADRLVGQMRESPHGWGPEDVGTVLKGHGFNHREGRKHTVYQHRERPELTITVPRHRELRAWVIRDTIKLIDELQQTRGR